MVLRGIGEIHLGGRHGKFLDPVLTDSATIKGSGVKAESSAFHFPLRGLGRKVLRGIGEKSLGVRH